MSFGSDSGDQMMLLVTVLGSVLLVNDTPRADDAGLPYLILSLLSDKIRMR
jgi:hypothetical protein